VAGASSSASSDDYCRAVNAAARGYLAERIASEHYSQCISAVRALDILVNQPQPDPLIIAAHNSMQLSAMTLGQKCGLTLQEIVSEFQPI
jgi:hypothetical protein